MATVSKWTPFDVALDITATSATVTRTATNKFTVKINASWETYYSGARTLYGMIASSGGSSVNLNTFGNKASSGSGSFTGTYSISGYGSASKTITVTFKNYNTDNGDSATKTVSFNVTVPAWPSYTITYNANGGSGAPAKQTKYKDVTLTLSNTIPTKEGHSFQGWGTTSTDTSVNYAKGASYTTNASITLYAIWRANTYTVSYNLNGGSGSIPNQTKTYGVALRLTSTRPTRTNYEFIGWGISASSTAAAYSSGGYYGNNANITLYAIWNLVYVKPKISNLEVDRAGSTHLEYVFDWEVSATTSTGLVSTPKATISWSDGSSDGSGSTEHILSGTSGRVSYVYSAYLNPETSYAITVTLYDGDYSTTITKPLSGTEVPIDVFYNHQGMGVAVGKMSERTTAFEVGFDAYMSKDIYMVGSGNVIYGTTLTGSEKFNAFTPVNEFGDTVIGYGHYGFRGTDACCDTHLYGRRVISNVYTPNGWKALKNYYAPQISGLDVNPTTINIDICTTGYVSSSKTTVYFTVPLDRPIIGHTPGYMTASSVNGFVLRQGNSYTHGSNYQNNSYVYVYPTAYTCELTSTCIKITARFSDTTNATNNDPIGVQWSGQITIN